jgi:predicted dehydrogenase
MKTIKVGILGAGSMGQTHVQRLLRMRGVQVTAVCDQDGACAAALNQSLLGGAAQCFNDFDAMLAMMRLDAVYVCLPPCAHDGQVEKAAAKGIHVFLEKPIALTEKRAKAMVAAIEKAGVVSQVGYHMRFATPVQRLKKQIASGRAGTPTLMQARFFCNALHSEWWRDVTRSGGQVFEQAIHIYDLALYLLGEAKSVAAYAGNLCHAEIEGYTVEDTSAAIIRFESGAMASIVASNCAVPTQWQGDFRLVCRKLTADVQDLAHATFYRTGGHPSEHYFGKELAVPCEVVEQEVDYYFEEDKNFIAAVRGTAQACSPARDGLRGIQLVTAVTKSAAQDGRRITVNA